MEKREANIIIAKAGGNASSNSFGCKVSLPKKWMDAMKISPENRNVDLYFDGEKILIEKQSFRPCEKKALASPKKIHRFALIWMQLYKNYKTVPGIYFESCFFLGEWLDELGFTMDCGNSLEKKFPGADGFRDNEAFKRILQKIDIETLGNAIFSQWRYWNHWAMDTMHEKDYDWFIIAFTRLAELTDCNEI